jgi:hypothetical protein
MPELRVNIPGRVPREARWGNELGGRVECVTKLSGSIARTDDRGHVNLARSQGVLTPGSVFPNGNAVVGLFQGRVHARTSI